MRSNGRRTVAVVAGTKKRGRAGQSSSAALSAEPTAAGTAQSSRFWWCWRAHVTVNGWLPASASMSAPTSSWRRYSPTRRVMPPAGGFDLSPLVAILLLNLASQLLHQLLVSLLASG